VSIQKYQPRTDLPEIVIELIKSKPFWIADEQKHAEERRLRKGNCCFNHIVGLPTKHGKGLPLFDYEIDLWNAFTKYKYLWILKATGLGISEFSLRYMAYLACSYKEARYKDSQMCIVVGPNMNLAIRLIKRLKDIFYPRLNITFDTHVAQVFINGIDISAFPSHNVNAFRSLTNPSFILIDEGDFFPIGQQIEVRHAAERYVGKSDATIALVSTPNIPNGLMQQIEQEEDSLYHRIRLDYTIGLNKIFTTEDIARARKSPTFEREYNLAYGYDIGNVLDHSAIQLAIDKSVDYPLELQWHYSKRSLGIDPGYASSRFAIVATEWIAEYNVIRVLYSCELDKPMFGDMVRMSYDLIKQFHINKVWVDGSQPEFIRELKQMVGENKNFEMLVDRAKKVKTELWQYMDVIPVAFNEKGRQMIDHMRRWFEDAKAVIIDKQFTDLIAQLRIATQKADGKLDKSGHQLDTFDAFRMALLYYQFEQ
jgi:hypothetical protein